jgi:hypothetical protein
MGCDDENNLGHWKLVDYAQVAPERLASDLTSTFILTPTVRTPRKRQHLQQFRLIDVSCFHASLRVWRNNDVNRNRRQSAFQDDVLCFPVSF